MELFRALAALAEAPAPGLAPLAAGLGLGELPAPHEHTELFTFQLVPYASIYLGENGRLGGDARDRIQGFWRVLGRVPEGEADHLTLMLASYAELCAPPGARIEADDDGARVDEGGAHQRRVFLHEHLLSWLPVYLMRVEELGGRFHRAWAGLLLDLLEREAVERPSPDVVSMHHRLSTPLETPDPEADDPLGALLDDLVAPIRSGVVLTRRDLAGAASDLDIGCRMGERRYMMEAMLRQRPAELIAWLAARCGRDVEAYGRRGGGIGRALAPWSERAQRTREVLEAVQPMIG